MDKALKQRLVGASVLIILAVIVLPMLLSGRSDTLKQESREIELPPKPEELSIETRRFPVGIPNKPVAELKEPATDQAGDSTDRGDSAGNDTVAASGESQAAPIQQDAATQEDLLPAPQTDDPMANESPVIDTPAPVEVEKPPAVTSITLNSGVDKNADITPAESDSESTPRYLVQVASFSSEKNANALASRLKADNLSVLMDVVERPAGLLHRVRVGPYAERSDADALVADLRSKISGLNPRVLDLRPRESAPVSTPSDPLVRWVVQVGSFSNSKSAEALVAELRLAGLTAFSEKVSSASGTAFKVRIGPELNRDRAAALARRVKTEHNLDGFVTTQE